MSETKIHDPKADFEMMTEFYLASNPHLSTNQQTCEMEVRFGTNTKKSRPISKIDYENVIQYLYSAGFTTSDPDGLTILRIQNEYYNKTRGETQISNIRAEIVGLDLVQEYCRTNNLQKLIDLPSTMSASADKIKFTQKIPPTISSRDKSKPLRPVDFPDFNFRVAFQMERDLNVRTETARKIVNDWSDSKKIFRYINRVRLSHPDYPVFADVSIVKGSPKSYDVPIPYYTVQEAKLFSNPEHYEIELEIDNQRVGPGTEFNTVEKLLESIRKCIRFVLSGLQGTNYPISNKERDTILQQYLALIHGKEYSDGFMQKFLNARNQGEMERRKRDMLRHFIGPSSFTLQLENIQDSEKTGIDSTVPSIRKFYTVTDKADGERKLLYIASNSRIYMIDTNMNVLFTGAVTKNKDLFNSLLDGEHIKYDKNGSYINLYAAFDIYYVHEKSVREYTFTPTEEEMNIENNKFRLPLLNALMQELKPASIMNVDGGNSDPTKKEVKTKSKERDHSCEIAIKCKDFYTSENPGGIFQGCSTILSKVRDGSYEYNTDGLIFTPMNMGVGSNRPSMLHSAEKIGHAGPLFKSTWEHSFKWKPPEFNTIDFLVSIKKDKTGKDEIHHVFQEGLDLTGNQNITQYKTLILMCGFDERKHGYLNPMLDIINDQLPTVNEIDNEESYKPVPFQPTNPYDSGAALCNVELRENGSTSNLVLLSEDHEYFEEDMIVEFRYDVTKPSGWRWIPLRVRYDKTTELRSGIKNYGNAYHVANGNWHSIHNPVTEEMIMTGINIPETTANEDVYYNRSGSTTNTKPLRDFHNLYVKRKLILGVSERGDTLIDYSVGKAGDLPKWISAKLGFVFGIDISKDNIENHLDGACARYLNFRKKYKQMPGALFVNGNSSLNIRSGKALISEKDKQIAMAVFGSGPKEKSELGEGVYKRYGVGEPGFNVSSCQFSLHYFFESEKTLHSFLRNLAECTHLNGHFIGTCYDGQTVFNLLQRKKRNEGITIQNREGDNKKMFELTKQYDETGFPDDELSLGYAIDVYQESINKIFREYLVNFKYFTRMMEDYGFMLVGEDEAKSMGLPSASGLFGELFDTMNAELQRDKRMSSEYGTAKSMTAEEQKISFMNRYFVFKKTRNVNAEKVGKILMRHYSDDNEEAELEKEEEKEKKGKEEKGKRTIRRISGPKVKVVIRSNSSVMEKDKEVPGIVLGKSVSIRIKPQKK